MGTGRTDEFRRDAVRIALTSGLTRRQVADDLVRSNTALRHGISSRSSLLRAAMWPTAKATIITPITLIAVVRT